jgi:hypothetical protein
MMRVSALEDVGGYRDDLIAGEEPELCARLRSAHWRIWRLKAEMAFHDAAMVNFGQWWRRGMRTGYAFAQAAHSRETFPEGDYVWASRRAWLLGVLLPVALLMTGLMFGRWAWAAWLIYPLHIVQKAMRLSGSLRERVLLALFYVLGHVAEGCGQIKFMSDRLLGRRARLIEYK